LIRILLGLYFAFGLWNHAFTQNEIPTGFYSSVEEFRLRDPKIKCSFEAKPYKKTAFDEGLLPNLFRLDPACVDVAFEPIIIAWDGENLYLNLWRLRMANNFVQLGKPHPLMLFTGREPSGPDQKIGGYYRGQQTNTETDMLQHKTYVFSLLTGRAYPLTSSTVERLLEPYPELLSLYTRDPNWKELETQKLYLDLLNDMLELETE
ncbi:MAG: hypothetical protein RL266_429, partial [Bacteroidota bacterium]|jgi:hypothetical protein